MKLIIDISEKTYKEIKMNGLYLCPTYYLDLEKALKKAKELNIADPKKGKWIPVSVSSGRDSWECSVCGRHARGKIKNLPYCHCGAKMEVSE